MQENWLTQVASEYGFTIEQAQKWWGTWRKESTDGTTDLSYIGWLQHKIAAARDELAITADQALDVLERYGRTADNDPVVSKLLDIISLMAPSLAAERERIRKEAASKARRARNL